MHARFLHHGRIAGLALVLLFAYAGAAGAQQAILAPGNAAVTGFSGAIPPDVIAPGEDPAEETFIDLEGPSLRVIDLRHMGALPSAQLVKAAKPYTWFASQIGQVFGVAADESIPPNLYVAATSAYGLPIVVTGSNGKPRHIKTGAAGAAFMPGLWGKAAPNGGPGSIWKIDGATGAVSLFANVAPDGRQNSGAALGGLAYDAQTKSLFVADRETGFIHRFDLEGKELGRYDHGLTGRRALGLAPVAFDAAPPLDIESQNFDSTDPATWHYAAPERRIFGLGVFRGRLYYAVAAGLQIWSVAILPDGSFGTDARIEIVVPAGPGPTEISKITFDEQNRMFLAERPVPTGAYDFEALTAQGIGRVLRYASFGTGPDGREIWQSLPDEYALGFPLEWRNGNGGVAIGYRYDAKGNILPGTCGGFMWASGEDLRNSPDPALAQKLEQTGPLHVNGLQGNETWRTRRNRPPLYAYFIGYDEKARGHMGDLAIVRACTPSAPTENFYPPLPRPAAGPPFAPPPPPGKCGPGIPPSACPPPSTCPPTTPVGQCPPTSCPPGQVRGRHSGECQQCTRPNVLIGNTCCTPGEVATNGACVNNNPGCPAGQTPVGPSNSCCPNNQIYTDASGGEACCPFGPPSNGKCQPPPPPGMSGCASGYVPVGNTCCLASQMTSTGICCPAGEVPSGPNNSQCTVLIHVPPIPIGGPSCCKVKGQIPVGPTGQCCDPADVTTEGQCCPVPVDPKNPGNCPAQVQSIVQCAAGYTRMPDGSCCANRLVSPDRKTCEIKGHRPPAQNCTQPDLIRNPRDPSACVTCGRGTIANEDHTACIKPPREHAPPRALPPTNCAGRGPRYVRDPRHPHACILCGRGLVANSSHTACVRPGVPPPYYEPPPYIPPPYYGPRPFGGPHVFGPGLPRGGGFGRGNFR
ncbi:MAG TPA: hypothetical protein VKV77_09965 [Methylovirgula sp.]|nr:hypothetical protein [Methylovirgula sp.]